ncbi:hypothetical protein AB0F52_11470 [Amycolatopsis sp. NPDC024027]|uniref:hypothetical protein n=1 Tax=Amycolatopsis sp. NPDC024027 TaxID=3154327 RepID=UPI0033EB0764
MLPQAPAGQYLLPVTRAVWREATVGEVLSPGIDLRRAVLYSLSGGLLTVAFGMFGCATAHAAPMPVDADGVSHARSERGSPPPVSNGGVKKETAKSAGSKSTSSGKRQEVDGGNQAPAKPSPREAAKELPGFGLLKTADSVKKVVDSAKSNTDKKSDNRNGDKQKGDNRNDKSDDRPKSESSRDGTDQRNKPSGEDKVDGREASSSDASLVPGGKAAMVGAEYSQRAANRTQPDDDGGVGAVLQPLLQATPGPEAEQDPLPMMPQPKAVDSAKSNNDKKSGNRNGKSEAKRKNESSRDGTDKRNKQFGVDKLDGREALSDVASLVPGGKGAQLAVAAAKVGAEYSQRAANRTQPDDDGAAVRMRTDAVAPSAVNKGTPSGTNQFSQTLEDIDGSLDEAFEGVAKWAQDTKASDEVAKVGPRPRWLDDPGYDFRLAGARAKQIGAGVVGAVTDSVRFLGALDQPEPRAEMEKSLQDGVKKVTADPGGAAQDVADGIGETVKDVAAHPDYALGYAVASLVGGRGAGRPSPKVAPHVGRPNTAALHPAPAITPTRPGPGVEVARSTASGTAAARPGASTKVLGALKGAVAAGAAVKGSRALGEVTDASNLISRANAAGQGAAGVAEGARVPVAAGARAVPGPGITSAPSGLASVEEVAAAAAKGTPGGGAGVLSRPAPVGVGRAEQGAGRALHAGGTGGRVGGNGPTRPGGGPAYGKAAPLVAGVAGTGVMAEMSADDRGDAEPPPKLRSPQPGAPGARTSDAPPFPGTAEPRIPPFAGRYPAPGRGERPAEPIPGARRGLDPQLAPWAVPKGPRGPGDPVPDNWGRPDPLLAPRGVPTEPSAPGSPEPGDWDLPDPRLTPWGVPTEPTSPGLPAPVVQSESNDLAIEEVIARPALVPLPTLLGPSITDIPRARFASPVWSYGGPGPVDDRQNLVDPAIGAYLREHQAQNTWTRRNHDRAAEAVPVVLRVVPELQKRADGAREDYLNGPGFTAGQLANQARIEKEADALIPLRQAEEVKVKAGKGDPKRLQRLKDKEHELRKKLGVMRKANAGTQQHIIFEDSVMRDAAEILGEFADEYRFRVEVPFNINGEAVPDGTARGKARKTKPDLVLERRAPDGTWYRVQDFDLKTGKKGIEGGWDFRNQRNARSLFKVITLRPRVK